jgi:molybdopterin-guanine dinucleotide biosynthesis protein A
MCAKQDLSRNTGIMSVKAEKHRVGGISAVVLAGGESQRLGVDKALLELNGQSLLARTVNRVAILGDDVIVVTNHPERYEHLALPVRFVPDERPGEGALMGLYSGLREATYQSAIAVACDMPFLNLPLLRYMIAKRPGCDAVVPRLENDMLEPLHAIYSKRCLPFIAKSLAKGRRRILAFFDKVKVHYVEGPAIAQIDPLYLSFVNVNTPADWQVVQELNAREELE